MSHLVIGSFTTFWPLWRLFVRLGRVFTFGLEGGGQVELAIPFVLLLLVLLRLVLVLVGRRRPEVREAVARPLRLGPAVGRVARRVALLAVRHSRQRRAQRRLGLVRVDVARRRGLQGVQIGQAERIVAAGEIAVGPKRVHVGRAVAEDGPRRAAGEAAAAERVGRVVAPCGWGAESCRTAEGDAAAAAAAAHRRKGIVGPAGGGCCFRVRARAERIRAAAARERVRPEHLAVGRGEGVGLAGERVARGDLERVTIPVVTVFKRVLVKVEAGVSARAATCAERLTVVCRGKCGGTERRGIVFWICFTVPPSEKKKLQGVKVLYPN